MSARSASSASARRQHRLCGGDQAVRAVGRRRLLRRRRRSLADDKPQVPTQLHFGEKDAGIPLTDVDTIKAKRPDVEVHGYPGAQHGFHCDERASYDKASSDIAWPRSLAFFAKHLKR